MAAVSGQAGGHPGGADCTAVLGRGRSDHAVLLAPEFVAAACVMVAEMVESLPSVLALGHQRSIDVPAFLTPVLRNIVVSLARLPLVNSYTRVPPLVRRQTRGFPG